MWLIIINKHHCMTFQTMKDIQKDFPFLNKDKIYNIRKRNKNKWVKNKKFNELIKIIRL